jgi:predicted MPP superfamily phosphohydrolase
MRYIIMILIFAVLEYYSFIVMRSAVRTFPPVWKTVTLSVYFLLTAIVISGILFFPNINWAKVPHGIRNIYIALSMGMFIGKILVLAIMLGDEVRRLVLWIISLFKAKDTTLPNNAGGGIPRSVFLMRFALLMGGLALSGFVYGVTNRYKYHLRRIRIKAPTMPESFKGLKVVQISDIHTGSFDNHDAVAAGIQRILDEKPDVIFFTGDLVNNRTDEVDAKYKEIYSRLKAPMGVYSTLGNHDYGDYEEWPSPQAKKDNLAAIKAIHGEMGWRLLLNEHVLLTRGEDSIAVIGVENISAKARFHSYGSLSKAWEGIEAKNAPYKILLSHDPSHWDAEVTPKYKDINLTLSGHTHGMQFGVEIPWLKWSPVQYVYEKWAGLYSEGDQHLYVNRGFGFLGYPGRLGIMPEITVFEFA